MTRRIDFFVSPTFDPLDLSGPLEVFYVANSFTPGSYELRVTSSKGGLVESATVMSVMTVEAVLDDLDTLVVVSGQPLADEPSTGQIDFIRQAAGRIRRIASVCVGAFALAEAGLLDDRVATTHWNWAAILQSRYPNIHVDGDRIFTSDNGIWTSAGSTTGVDMALALVEEDLGREVARAVARMLVVYHRRSGGQLQYSSLLERDPDSDRIRRALAYARENLDTRLTVESLADVAQLSVRQFGRAFLAATGTTPAKAVEHLRVEAARPRIEDGRETLDEIARSVGLIDAGRMRQSFIRVAGQTPQGIRRLARRNDG